MNGKAEVVIVPAEQLSALVSRAVRDAMDATRVLRCWSTSRLSRGCSVAARRTWTPSQAGKEPFGKAAACILREQEAKGSTAERRHRVRAFALPVIGHIEIAQPKAPHIHSVLVGMEAQRAAITERAKRLGVERVASELGLNEQVVARWAREHESGAAKRFAVDTVHHTKGPIFPAQAGKERRQAQGEPRQQLGRAATRRALAGAYRAYAAGWETLRAMSAGSSAPSRPTPSTHGRRSSAASAARA